MTPISRSIFIISGVARYAIHILLTLLCCGRNVDAHAAEGDDFNDDAVAAASRRFVQIDQVLTLPGSMVWSSFDVPSDDWSPFEVSGTASMPILFRFDVVHNSPTGLRSYCCDSGLLSHVQEYRLSEARVAQAPLPGVDAQPVLHLHEPGQLLPLVSGSTFLLLGALDLLDRQPGHHGREHQAADFAIEGEEVSAKLVFKVSYRLADAAAVSAIASGSQHSAMRAITRRIARLGADPNPFEDGFRQEIINHS
jgi:hypothetical protein